MIRNVLTGNTVKAETIDELTYRVNAVLIESQQVFLAKVDELIC